MTGLQVMLLVVILMANIGDYIFRESYDFFPPHSDLK
jgi:hypothetical protein